MHVVSPRTFCFSPSTVQTLKSHFYRCITSLVDVFDHQVLIYLLSHTFMIRGASGPSPTLTLPCAVPPPTQTHACQTSHNRTAGACRSLFVVQSRQAPTLCPGCGCPGQLRPSVRASWAGSMIKQCQVNPIETVVEY